MKYEIFLEIRASLGVPLQLWVHKKGSLEINLWFSKRDNIYYYLQQLELQTYHLEIEFQLQFFKEWNGKINQIFWNLKIAICWASGWVTSWATRIEQLNWWLSSFFETAHFMNLLILWVSYSLLMKIVKIAKMRKGFEAWNISVRISGIVTDGDSIYHLMSSKLFYAHLESFKVWPLGVIVVIPDVKNICMMVK